METQDELINRFRAIFWDAFHRPKLSTEKYIKLYSSLQSVSDWLAGPLFSVYENGQCDYVFQNNDRFKIKNVEDFMDWCMEEVNEYRMCSEKTLAETEEEKKDQQILLYQSEVMMELCEIAYIIQKERLEGSALP